MKTSSKKMAETRANNMMRKALMVRRLVDEHYEPGRQDRNRKWVYRNIVSKIYPMSMSTFWRYMRMTRERSEYTNNNDAGQLHLF